MCPKGSKGSPPVIVTGWSSPTGSTVRPGASFTPQSCGDNDNALVERGRVSLTYLSPCPHGYETILGYLAKSDPELLAYLVERPEDTQRDGFKLTHWCRVEGLRVHKVEASPWLRRQGILTVNAYPVELLQRRFPSVT